MKEIIHKFKRTDKATNEIDWLYIYDDVSDYGWIDDCDKGDNFTSHNIFLELTKELNIDLDFENYDYLLEESKS